MYMVQGFETMEEAKAFVKSRNGSGAIYSQLNGSRTKRDYWTSIFMVGLDPEKYPVTVNWNEPNLF